ncbi:MAG TPA: beta-propeller domain-containing protein [Jatrophihabitantaceae bacterium]|jgi:uncharacterized secreted protein with C-terminal beta-propeller domain
MRIWLRIATFLVVTGTLVALAVSLGREKAPTRVGGGVRLVAYTGCADLLSQLRQHAAAHADQLGYRVLNAAGGVAVPESSAAAAAPTAPQHSTTTVHEPGVDEPDVVKTDGRRVVTVSRGALYVVDTATRRITGRVQLPRNSDAWSPANLVISGDRALVIDPAAGDGGMGPMPSLPASQLVLVDLSTPRVLGTMAISGSYVDARMVGSMVRLVARSQPRIEPLPGTNSAMSSAVLGAPLSAWLPSYRVTEGGVASQRTVDCARVSHPRDYTGTSMLTIYSIDLPGHLGDIAPISLAADGDTVYGTTGSLYVASNPYWFYAVPIAVPQTLGGGAEPMPGVPLMPQLPPQQTDIHRFDITGSGPPRYVASGSVPGRLLNQYALSDYDGYLRVATTSGEAATESAVYELRAETLTRVGSVGGLGKGQRIYAVRFIGPVGYVVTFRQVDPLYTLDLRDPTRPRVTGELELTGYSSYLAPAADGQLIGVGQEATNEGRTVGLQVALFDVQDPAHPRRLAQLIKTDFHSAAEFDPHAFLYWPTTGTAVLPVNSWTSGSYTQSALVLTVGASGISVAGTITQPGAVGPVGITRAMVVGDELWTLWDSGLMVSDLGSLTTEAWIAF